MIQVKISRNETRKMQQPRFCDPICLSVFIVELGPVRKGFARGSFRARLRGQTEPFRRFSLILADSRPFPENKAFGKRRFSQKTAGFRRKLQKTAGTHRKPHIGVCPFRFVLGARPKSCDSISKKSVATALANYIRGFARGRVSRADKNLS